MSVQEGFIFRGGIIVIPITQRKEVKELLHTAHLGIEATLRRARESIYWPGINRNIKQTISILYRNIGTRASLVLVAVRVVPRGIVCAPAGHYKSSAIVKKRRVELS